VDAICEMSVLGLSLIFLALVRIGACCRFEIQQRSLACIDKSGGAFTANSILVGKEKLTDELR
jgi:hypothetical protein